MVFLYIINNSVFFLYKFSLALKGFFYSSAEDETRNCLGDGGVRTCC
jgi:hypothetical protein